MRPVNFELRGRGAAVEWLRAHANHQGDDCLIWPFCRHPTGYGSFGTERKQHYAHRYICELAHGPAPSEAHQCAHSCGNGHEGCVNPRHLAWKTVTENLLDKREHGTVPEGWFRLTHAQVAEIRSLKGRMTQARIAAKFGIKRGTVQYWHRHSEPPAPVGTSTTALHRQEQKRMRLASKRKS